MATPTLGSSQVEGLARQDYARLVRSLTLWCGSAEAAEDAVQEALAKAWQRAERGEKFNDVAGWVAVVAMNHVRSGARRLAARDRAMSRWKAGRDDTARPVDVTLTVALGEAVDRLPDRQRQVVVLHYLLGYSVADAAALLGLSDGGVKNALFRARGSLALALRDDDTHEAVRP